MKRIPARDVRKDTRGYQTFGQHLDSLIEIEKRNGRKHLKAFRCLYRLTIRSLIQDELRSKKIELLALIIPPLASDLLPRELQQIAGWARDVVARNSGLYENGIRHL